MQKEESLMAGKYMTFVLGREEYGISLSKIREILITDGMSDSDLKDPCVRGVIHIRNQKIQVLDLNCRFGLKVNPEQKGCAVLVATSTTGKMFGLMVDSIRQVLHIKTTVLEKSSMDESDPRAGFIIGRVHAEGRDILIVDFDKSGELSAFLSQIE